MPLPKELTTVTTTSKNIALIMFITLPVIGFLWGMKYQSFIYNYNTNRNMHFSRVLPASQLQKKEHIMGDTLQDPSDITKLVDQIASLAANLQWQDIQKIDAIPDIPWYAINSQVDYRNRPRIPGMFRTARGTSSKGYDDQPEIYQFLKDHGYKFITTADAPGSSSLKFVKNNQGKHQVVSVNLKNLSPTNYGKNESIKFAPCPCIYEVTIYVSYPF